MTLNRLLRRISDWSYIGKIPYFIITNETFDHNDDDDLFCQLHCLILSVWLRLSNPIGTLYDWFAYSSLLHIKLGTQWYFEVANRRCLPTVGSMFPEILNFRETLSLMSNYRETLSSRSCHSEFFKLQFFWPSIFRPVLCLMSCRRISVACFEQGNIDGQKKSVGKTTPCSK